MCRRLKLSRRTSLISRIAGIDLILNRLDQQDEVARKILEQATKTNARVTKLETQEVARSERERLVRETLDGQRDDRRVYWGAAIGAGCIGAVTLMLHLAGIA